MFEEQPALPGARGTAPQGDRGRFVIDTVQGLDPVTMPPLPHVIQPTANMVVGW